MHARRFGSAIVRGDTNEDVFGGGFGILDDHIEISILGEDASIEQLKFGILFRTAPVFFQQLSVGIGALRIRSEEHTSELQSRLHLVCRLLLEKKKKKTE